MTDKQKIDILIEIVGQMVDDLYAPKDGNPKGTKLSTAIPFEEEIDRANELRAKLAEISD